HAFNEHVKNDPRTEQVMITLRDGISMIKKKKE
ncbi:MAG: methyltransferase, partial [Sediminibacterium sp.]